MGARVVVIGFMIAALIAGSMVVRARGRTTPVASAETKAVQPPTTVTVVPVRRAQVTARVVAPGSVTSIRDRLPT